MELVDFLTEEDSILVDEDSILVEEVFRHHVEFVEPCQEEEVYKGPRNPAWRGRHGRNWVCEPGGPSGGAEIPPGGGTDNARWRRHVTSHHAKERWYRGDEWPADRACICKQLVRYVCL